MAKPKTPWEAAQQCFEDCLALLTMATPEVLLATGEMLAAYAGERCDGIGMSLGRMAQVCAKATSRGSNYYKATSAGKRVH